MAPCDQSMYCLSCKSTEELSFMTLKRYANFEEKLTCGLKKDLRNLVNFHQSTLSKLGLWWDPFVQSRKGMTLKFAEELCVMAMKNNAKFEELLTYHFKTDMRKLTNCDSSTRKSKKLLFNCLLWPKYIMLELRKVRGVMSDDTEDWCHKI